ncbi:MAG: malto-oligosyltrehalose trehalohydrolase [SAR324 cluster bacterium]|nr:malto-oligosyltrehalose trehalohydrolase [SAR324 cluster bacterium]
MKYHFGPQLLEEGVCFRVWAPGAGKVGVILDPNDQSQYIPMNPAEDGFYEIHVSHAGEGTRYFFSRDEGPLIPDPASHFQPDGVHGASQIVDLSHAWDNTWHGLTPEQLIIYELHVGTYTAEGTYQGISQKLDFLADLGITAIEIMPLAAFPGKYNWGYDGVFHFSPFAGYGHPKELQSLVDQCHQRGMAVIIDVVTNHFGPDGNAMWSMAPDFFNPDRPSAWSDGLSWEAEPVLRYFDEVALHWIQHYGMDGIRFDAFHAIPKDVRHLHLKRMIDIVEEHTSPDQHLAYLLETPDNQVSLLHNSTSRVTVVQFNFDFSRAAHALLTGERQAYYQDYHPPAPELSKCLDQGFSFFGRFSNYRNRVVGETSKPVSWDTIYNFTQNHDSCGNRYLGQRLDALTDRELLMAMTTLMMLHPGIPSLFMGQEWSASTPFYFFTDFSEELGQNVETGRKKQFFEHDFSASTQHAPGCQDPSAFYDSVLQWDELQHGQHQRFLQFFKNLIVVRQEVIPVMSRQISDLQVVSSDSAQYRINIKSRHAGEKPFLLAANLEDEIMMLPDLPKDLIYTSRAFNGNQVPGKTVALFRQSQ